MRQAAAKTLRSEGFAVARQSHGFTVDMRYVGQSFTLAVPFDPAATGWDALREDFVRRHARTFGHADINNDAEIANIRLVSLGIVDKPDLTYAPENSTDVLAYRRSVWFDGCWTDCPVYDRVAMEAGFEFEGPAIVEEAGGTSVVPPGWRIEVLASGTLDCRYRFTP